MKFSLKKILIGLVSLALALTMAPDLTAQIVIDPNPVAVIGKCRPAIPGGAPVPANCDGSSCSLLDPVCTDPRAGWVHTPGGCRTGSDQCFEFNINLPRWRYRECHCSSFPSGFCSGSNGTYDRGRIKIKTCV